MKRLLGALFAGAVVTAAAYHPLCAVEQRPDRRRVEGMADLRPRSRRHALLAADADHAGQCQPAQGGVGVSHEARRRAAPAAGAAAQARSPAAGRAAAAEGAAGSGFRSSETTPLVVDGMMYISTPYARVVALDPTTGKEVWVFQLPAGSPSTRGVEYWPGDAQTPAQIVFGTSDGKLYSLDAKTGKPNEAFGDKGIVDLNTPEILQGLPGRNGLSSPPIVYKNLVITGGTHAGESAARDRPATCAPGTCTPASWSWTFRSMPRAGEKYNDTWAGDSWKNRSGVNVWGFITVDVQRGIVYMPFGAPSVDQYGGDRAGDNLFGTSLVAADANTGKYLWHFQVVHHDIWDADLAGAPALIDVKQGGRTIPAVAVINKLGLLFLLDRVTGKPIYGVEERPVPQSEVPLERAAKTQPFPLKPPPLSRMTMTAGGHRDGHARSSRPACRKLIEGVQLGGPYLPPGYNRLRVQFPGNHGGVNWGGTSFNPQLGYLFVNTNELGQLSGLKDRDPNATGPAAGRRGRATASIRMARTRACRRRTLQHRSQRSATAAVPAAAVGTVDRGQREHGRVRVARAARRHRQPAARQAEDRPSRQRRHDRHRRRARLRRRDRRQPVPRVRREDRQGAVDRASSAAPRRRRRCTYQGRGRQAVRRHHVDRRRLLRQPGDRRQHHGVRAGGRRSRGGQVMKDERRVSSCFMT